MYVSQARVPRPKHKDKGLCDSHLGYYVSQAKVPHPKACAKHKVVTCGEPCCYLMCVHTPMFHSTKLSQIRAIAGFWQRRCYCRGLAKMFG
jgi:hypothetical protein